MDEDYTNNSRSSVNIGYVNSNSINQVRSNVPSTERNDSDDQELLKKRLQVLLEKDLSTSVQKTLKDSIASYHSELDAIAKNTHAGLMNAIQLTESEYEIWKERLQLFYEYQQACCEELYHFEKEAILSDFQTETEGLQEEMLEAIENKKRKLIQDRDNYDITPDPTSGITNTSSTRKTTRQLATERAASGMRKKAKEKGAVLPFVLRDGEINEDLSVMRRALGPGGRYRPAKRRF